MKQSFSERFGDNLISFRESDLSEGRLMLIKVALEKFSR